MMRISALSLLLLFGCAGSDDKDYSFRPVASIYNEARVLMLEGRYKKAAEVFNEAERQHPYSWWALKGQVMAVFCYYKANKYEEAVLTASRFTQLHPSHPDIPYVLYLQGLSYYERVRDAPRDQRYAVAALAIFKAVQNRFADSPYAAQSARKILFLENVRSGKNMHIGRFYQKNGNCIAALGRYSEVVNKFQQTEQVQEALYRLGECYLTLGLVRDAVKAISVLGHNYPQDVWYRRGLALLGENGITADSEPKGYLLSQLGSIQAIMDKSTVYQKRAEIAEQAE